MADMSGQQLGNYRLTRLLGQGGFADVYLGEHVHLNTLAAIKVLRTRVGEENAAQFKAEAQIIAHLDHPNIVRVLEFGVDDGLPFLVMDYAINGTLRQRHVKGSQLPLAFITPYVQQAADALQYAHNQRVIHRDLKPENMLLGKRGEVLLSDFGLAITAQSSRYSHTQEIVGTVAYMAPEQLQGKPCAASDQYALGIVVYEWLSGQRPFQGSFIEIYSQHLNVPPPSLCSQLPDLPPYVEQAVFMALAKQPEERFQSVRAFANALTQAGEAMNLSGRDVTLRKSLSPTPPAPSPQPVQLPAAGQTDQAPLALASLTTEADSVGDSLSQATTLPPSTPTPGAPTAHHPQSHTSSSPADQASRKTGRQAPARRARGSLIAMLAAALVLVLLFSTVAVPRLAVSLLSQRPTQSPTPGGATTAPISGASTPATGNTTPGSSATATNVTNTFTPTPTGRLLYQADWSQGLDGWQGSPEWKPIGDGSLGSDGSDRSNYNIWAPFHPSTPNYAVVAQIQFGHSVSPSGEGDYEFDIIVRGDGNQGGYKVGMSSIGSTGGYTQAYSCGRVFIVAFIDFLSAGSSSGCLAYAQYQMDNDVHTYRVEVKYDTITLFIDNQQIVQTTNNRYLAPGQVGLRSIYGDINVKSFAVYAL
jgi:serine/threonine protein kinase